MERKTIEIDLAMEPSHLWELGKAKNSVRAGYGRHSVTGLPLLRHPNAIDVFEIFLEQCHQPGKLWTALIELSPF